MCVCVWRGGVVLSAFLCSHVRTYYALPYQVAQEYAKIKAKGEEAERKWNQLFESYKAQYPNEAKGAVLHTGRYCVSLKCTLSDAHTRTHAYVHTNASPIY